MKKIISTLLTVTLLTSLIGCQSQYGISNGAYSDISLNRDSKEYSIKRLKEVNVESKALFGIPIDKSVNKKQGVIVRFNGINLTASRRFWPIVSMVGVGLATGMVVQGIAGTKTETVRIGSGINSYTYTVDGGNKLSLGVATLIGLPVAGAINNQLWSSSLSRAAWELNNQLIENNPDVDVFLNPKYDIDLQHGIWTQKAVIKAKVMGATIKTDN
jgi:hypothetical protein